MITHVIGSYFRFVFRKARGGWGRFPHPAKCQSFPLSPAKNQKESLCDCGVMLRPHPRFQHELDFPLVMLKDVFARIAPEDRTWSERAVVGSVLVALVVMPSCVSIKEANRRAEVRYWQGRLDCFGVSTKGAK